MYFLNINKPKGITSFDVIRILRKKLNEKQIGHSGTLDPLASGVLQIAVGRACKLLDYLSSKKTYVADIKFGYNSTTGDEEGEKKFIKTPDFSQSEFIEVLNSFLGKTMQAPPKYSAVKINGKKMYEIARKNPDFEIEIPKREIEIYDISILDFKGDMAKIKVACKKGTYIRSLVFDIGKKLGCGAYMSDLIRVKAGNFSIEDSNNLSDENFKKINPVNVLEIQKLELSDSEFELVINGAPIKNRSVSDKNVLLTKHNKLVSIADLSDNLIKPRKVFWSK